VSEVTSLTKWITKPFTGFEIGTLKVVVYSTVIKGMIVVFGIAKHALGGW